MLNPAIADRVAELRGAGTPTGDAIGQAVAEQRLRDNPPPWLAELLVEPDNPEGEPDEVPR